MKQQLPINFEGTSENIYANFGARFSAVLLDGLILSPIILITLILNNKDLHNYYYTTTASNLIMLFYYIYLPKKYGATPGKLLLNLKILKIDGTSIGYEDAFLRYLPTLVLTVLSIASNLIAVNKADITIFNNSSWTEQSAYFNSLNPTMFYSQIVLTNLYLFTNLIIFQTNPRKRSISDFSGDTVVVNKNLLKKIEHHLDKTKSKKL